MSKNNCKKWVGIFLLAIVMLFGFTIDVNFNNKSNVYAANGCGTLSRCTGAKKKNGDCKKIDGNNCKCVANASNWKKGSGCTCDSGYGKINSDEAKCYNCKQNGMVKKGNYCEATAATSDPDTSSSDNNRYNNNNNNNNNYNNSNSYNSNSSTDNTTTNTNESTETDEDEYEDTTDDAEDSDPYEKEIEGLGIKANLYDPTYVSIKANSDAKDIDLKIIVIDFDQNDYKTRFDSYKSSNSCKKSKNKNNCAKLATMKYYAKNYSKFNGFIENQSYNPKKNGDTTVTTNKNGDFMILFYSEKYKKVKKCKKSKNNSCKSKKYDIYTVNYQVEGTIGTDRGYDDIANANTGNGKDSTNASNDSVYSTASFEDGSACQWAVQEYYKYYNDQNWKTFADALRYKTMGSCFPTKNGNLTVTVDANGKVSGGDDGTVAYNISTANLDLIKDEMAIFEKTYETYLGELEKLGINPGDTNAIKNLKLPDLDEKWIKVDDPDLSKKGRTDALKDSATNKTGYENAKSSKKDMLTCDNRLDGGKTYKYLYYDKKEDINATMIDFDYNDHMTSKTPKTKKVCDYTCREQLAIAFDAPQAVTPGNCFTYKVEIKSTTTCVANPDWDSIPDFRTYSGNDNSCQNSPVCGNGTPTIDSPSISAGPNEDFDSCVVDCDGGKYTNKCINKCFNKVYGKSDEKSTKVAQTTDLTLADTKNLVNNNSAESTNVVKVKSSDKKSNFSHAEICSSNSLYRAVSTAYGVTASKNPPTEAYIRAVYNYVNSHVQGSSTATDQSCYWTQYAKYYFKNLAMAAMTVCNDEHYKLSWTPKYENGKLVGNYSCSPSISAQKCTDMGKNCYRGMWPKNKSSYYPSSPSEKGKLNKGIGFKRNRLCDDVCKWSQDADKDLCWEQAGEIEDQFVKDLSSFVGAINTCVSKADSCKDNSITYTMTANDDTDNTSTDKQSCEGSNYDQELCRKFPSAKGEEQKKKELNNASHSFPTVVELNAGQCAGKVVDGCDGKTDSYTDANGNKIDCTWKNNTKALITQYHGIITFPGAWIENKHGYVVYDDMSAESQWYKKVSGKYCTPSTAKKVNVKFFDEYLRAKNGCTLDKVSKSTPDVYNIISKVESFGMFDWKFKTGCYYALDDDPEPINTKNCPNSTKTASCDTTKDPNCKNVSCTGTGCSSIPDSSCDNKTDKTCTTRMGNYVARSYDSQNMFTSSGTKPTSNKVSKSTKVSTSTVEYQAGNVKKVADAKTSASASRQPGFNWSVNATNLSIANYPITPTLLAAKIKSQGDSIYNNDNELDYEIYLNKKNIENIRKITNGDKDYTYFKNGTYKTINNEDYWDAYKNAGYYTDATKLDTSEKGGYDAPSSDIPTIKYYVSKFLRTSPEGSKNTTEGYGSLLRKPSEEALKCNNILNGTACDPLTSYDIDEDTKTTLNNFIKSAS